MPPLQNSDARLSFSGGTLLLEGMTRAGIERIFRTPFAFDQRVDAWRCDPLHYADVRAALESRCHGFRDLVRSPETIVRTQTRLPLLRSDQRAAVTAWRAAGRGVIVMPTGTGKTEVALAIMAETAVSTLVVAPVRDLMYQWHRRIAGTLGDDAGLLGDGIHNVRPVTVTTYESACIHMERVGDRFGLIIFDECHHLPGPVRSDAARMCVAPLRLGLTATLEHQDGRQIDLDSLIGPVVYEMSIAGARGQSIADYDVVRIPVHLAPGEQRCYDRSSEEIRRYVSERMKRDAQFSWKDLCQDTAADPEARRALQAFYAKKAIEDRAEEKLGVLEDLFRLHQGEPMIIFAGSNAMARDVSMRFLIPCLLSHSGREERRDVLCGLAEGVYPALVANRVLDEGVDLPAVKVAVVIGGGAGSRQAKQRLGRVLRKSGTARAVLYEVVCTGTTDEERSRSRRRNDAYAGKQRRMRRNRNRAIPSERKKC